MSRAVRFAVGAAALAVDDSGMDTSRLDPGRFGVCMGTGITPVDVGELVDPIMKGVGTDGAFDMGRFALPGPSRSFRSGCCSTFPTWPRPTSRSFIRRWAPITRS